eukprot:1485448-Prymnesium_polylepis.1
MTSSAPHRRSGSIARVATMSDLAAGARSRPQGAAKPFLMRSRRCSGVGATNAGRACSVSYTMAPYAHMSCAHPQASRNHS